MSTEVAHREESSIDTLPPAQPPSVAAQQMLRAHAAMMQDAYELASKMVMTTMVPTRFLRKPEDATAAILYGAELGLNPIQSLQRVVPIHGMPSLEARTMVGLLKARGYKVKTTAQSYESVTVEGWDLDGEHYTSTWTIERATLAGYVPTVDEKTGKFKLNANGKLIGNEKYLTDPQAMLKAKAQSEVCREMAPDVLLGISYTAEELESERWDGTLSVEPPRARTSKPVTEDEIFAEEAPIPEPEATAPGNEPYVEAAESAATAFPDPSDPLAGPRRSEPKPTPTTVAAATSNEVEKQDTEQAAEPAAAPPAKAAAKKPREVSKLRPGLEKRLFTLLGDAGLSGDRERDGRIAVYRAVLQRDDIESTNDLTDVEVTTIGDQLYRWQDAGILADEIAGILADAARDAEETTTTTEGSE